MGYTDDMQWTADVYGHYQFIFTGHSLGGAMTVLAAEEAMRYA